MRTLFLTLLFLGSSLALPAQYLIVNVKGTVYANKKMLKKKDKINETDTLRFSSATAYVYVTSPKKGDAILAVNNKHQKVKGEFIIALRDALVPPNKFVAATTRTNEPYEAMDFNDQYDLKAFFREELFFIAPAKFKVSAEYFPLDSNHFFMIRHQLAEGWVGKALPHSEQAFELNQTILQWQGKVLNENVIQHSALYFVDNETREEQYLGSFKLQFLAPTAIQEELTMLYDTVGDLSAEQFLRERAMPYLHLLYGKTQPEAIVQLVAHIQK